VGAGLTTHTNQSPTAPALSWAPSASMQPRFEHVLCIPQYRKCMSVRYELFEAIGAVCQTVRVQSWRKLTSLSARLTTSRTFCTASPILCHGWSRPQPCCRARDVNTVSGVRCGMPGWHQAAVRWLTSHGRRARQPLFCARTTQTKMLFPSTREYREEQARPACLLSFLS